MAAPPFIEKITLLILNITIDGHGTPVKTVEGKEIYAKHKSTVETIFGIIEEVLGFRRFHLRSMDAAQGEWNLVYMSWNMKRLYALAG